MPRDYQKILRDLLFGEIIVWIWGGIPAGLSQNVDRYARQFVNVQPNWSAVLYNLAMSSMRKGKISDLTYIIDQMLNHLKAIHGPQSHNQNIYDYVEFEAKQASIIQFIEQISTFNQHLLAFADTACNIVLSVAAAAIGLVLVLASVFFLASSLLGFALLIGGAYSAYSFIAQLEGQVNQLEKQMMQIVDKAQKLPEDTSLLGTKNHHAFFSSIFIPLPYTALTAVEQLVFDESIQNRLSEERGNLEKITTMLAQL